MKARSFWEGDKMFDAGILQIFGEDAILGFVGGMIVTTFLARWINHGAIAKNAKDWVKQIIVMVVAFLVALAWDVRADGSIDWKVLPSIFLVYTFSATTLFHWIFKPMLESIKKRINSNTEEE